MKLKPIIHEISELERGFIIVNYLEHHAPKELTARDLWNAWNTCLKYGNVGMDDFFTKRCFLDTGEVKIAIHEASGMPGSHHGLSIVKSDLFSPNVPGPELKNGVLVLWDQDLTVAEYRGYVM